MLDSCIGTDIFSSEDKSRKVKEQTYGLETVAMHFFGLASLFYGEHVAA